MYRNPLVDGNLISQTEVVRIFGNVNDLLNTNRMILSSLEKMSSLPPAEQDVGSVFLEYVTSSLSNKQADFLKIYTTYCSNSNFADVTLKSLKRSNKTFNNAIENYRMNPRCNNVALDAYIIKPVQRFLNLTIYF